MIIKNTKTEQIIECDYLKNGDWRELTSEELTQYTTDKEQEFLQKEKEKAIEVKIKELTPKSILGTIAQQEKDELQTMMDNL